MMFTFMAMLTTLILGILLGMGFYFGGVFADWLNSEFPKFVAKFRSSK